MSFDPKNLTLSQALEQLSLTAANFGNAEVFSQVFDDWLRFLGGKPGEVVVVDGGSTPQMHDIYWRMFKERKIDKLQVIHSDHPENDKNKCFFQEHAAGAIANKPYLLFFKSDTLPYRQGHDNWLTGIHRVPGASGHIRRRRKLQRAQQAPRGLAGVVFQP